MATPLYVSPNWSEGYSETREFLTDIFVSRSGKEQRRARRAKPRCTISFSALLDAQSFRKMETSINLAAGQDLKIGSFVTPSPQLLISAEPGSTTLIVDTLPAAADFCIASGISVEYLKYVSQSNVTNVVSTIATSGKQLVLESPIQTRLREGARLRPVVEGKVGVETAISMASAGVGSASLKFELEPGTIIPGSLTTVDLPVAGPWDLAFAGPGVLALASINVGGGPTTNPAFFEFRSDGTSAYFFDDTPRILYQFTLSSPWDLATATYSSKSYSVAAQMNLGSGQDFAFTPDGLGLFLMQATFSSTGNIVYRHNLATAWDISTASYSGQSFDVGSQDRLPTGLAFRPDGTQMFVGGRQNDKVYQYNLPTPWNLTTASYANVSLTVADGNPSALRFRPDGTSLYIGGYDNTRVMQYALPSAWTLTGASLLQSLSMGGGNRPGGLAFKPDGTRLYVKREQQGWYRHDFAIPPIEVPVFLVKPNWISPPTVNFVTPYEVVDYSTGIIASYAPVRFSSRTATYNFTESSYDDAMLAVQLFETVRGMVGEFYMPTWTSDLEIASNTALNATSIFVKRSEVAQLYATDKTRRGIAIYKKDGSIVTLLLTAIDSVAPAGQSRLTLASPLSAALSLADVSMVSWLPLCRFASDSLTLNWVTDTVANFVMNVQTLESL